MSLLKKDKRLVFDYDYFGQTCFHWAAKRNYYDLLKELLEIGQNINMYDNNQRTPLFLAAENNHFEAVRLLIDHNASPYMKNKNGLTPIDVCKDIKIKKLIEEGEKVIYSFSYFYILYFYLEKWLS